MERIRFLVLLQVFLFFVFFEPVRSVIVYRNPDFYSELKEDYEDHLKQYPDQQDYNSYGNLENEEPDEEYKYPGEPKRPNTFGSRESFDTNYDGSPEFQHPEREIPYSPPKPPKNKPKPFGHYKHASPEYSSYEHGTKNFDKDYDDTYDEVKSNYEQSQTDKPPAKYSYSVKIPNENIVPDDEKVGSKEFQKIRNEKKKTGKKIPGYYTCQTVIRKVPHHFKHYYQPKANYKVVVPYWKKTPHLTKQPYSIDYHGAYKLNSDYDSEYENFKKRNYAQYQPYIHPGSLQGFIVSING